MLSFRNRLVFIGLFSLGIGLSLAVGAKAKEEEPPEPTPSKAKYPPGWNEASARRMTEVFKGVGGFQKLSLTNYAAALSKYANKKARRQFETLDRSIWSDTKPLIGWSYFIGVSLVTVGNVKRATPLVSFYNPWCDVFLITAWETQKEGARMVDVEMVMGDWLRTKDTLPSDPVPAWIRDETYKPLAVGHLAARSITAFEKLFPAKMEGDWRERLPGLDDSEVLAANYKGIAVLIQRNLLNIDQFRTAQEGESESVASARQGARAAIQLLRSGNAARLLETADETLPAMKALLTKVPPEMLKPLQVVTALTGQQESVVFLAPSSGANYFVSLLLKGPPPAQKATRVDFIYYEGMVEMLSKK